MEIRYPAILVPEPDCGYLVQFADFDEAFTDGDTLEEALFNAAEVLALMLEGRIDEGQPVPEPSDVAGAHPIAPSARVQAALLVRRTCADRPFAHLVRALDTSCPAAQRLEDSHHSPMLKKLERAAAALGKRLVLAFE